MAFFAAGYDRIAERLFKDMNVDCYYVRRPYKLPRFLSDAL
jgi:hypothetical protein